MGKPCCILLYALLYPTGESGCMKQSLSCYPTLYCPHYFAKKKRSEKYILKFYTVDYTYTFFELALTILLVFHILITLYEKSNSSFMALLGGFKMFYSFVHAKENSKPDLNKQMYI